MVKDAAVHTSKRLTVLFSSDHQYIQPCKRINSITPAFIDSFNFSRTILMCFGTNLWSKMYTGFLSVSSNWWRYETSAGLWPQKKGVATFWFQIRYVIESQRSSNTCPGFIWSSFSTFIVSTRLIHIMLDLRKRSLWLIVPDQDKLLLVNFYILPCFASSRVGCEVFVIFLVLVFLQIYIFLHHTNNCLPITICEAILFCHNIQIFTQSFNALRAPWLNRTALFSANQSQAALQCSTRHWMF